MIPKIIHLCWLSGDPYPRKIQDCLDSWKKHLPSYEIILWDTKRFNIHEVPWVEQAFNTKKYAFAADYIRLYALYHHGGIYLDSDVEILKSLDNFLELPYFVGAETSGTIEAAILGAEKGCDWIKCCLDYYEGRNFIREDGSYDIRMLPEILNETILRLKPVINMPSGSNIDDLKKKDLGEAVYVLPKSRKTKRDGCEKRNAFIETKTKCASNLIRKVTAYLQNQSKTPSLYIKINGIQMDF